MDMLVGISEIAKQAGNDQNYLIKQLTQHEKS